MRRSLALLCVLWLIGACTPAVSRPIDQETPTLPPATATPTEVIPTPTPTVEATPTPEVVQAPQIEGLSSVFAEGKWTYTGLEGNAYGLEVGEYAGETINYTLNNEAALGVVLTPEVVRVLMEEANTPEAISAGEWKIPFPLDARGEENLRIEAVKDPEYWDTYQYRWFAVGGLSPQAVFIAPFMQAEARTSGYSPSFEALATNVFIPFYETEWRLVFAYPEGSNALIGGFNTEVSLGQAVLSGITTELKGPKAPSGSQVIILMGPEEAKVEDDEDITDNILKVGGSNIFLAVSN